MKERKRRSVVIIKWKYWSFYIKIGRNINQFIKYKINKKEIGVSRITINFIIVILINFMFMSMVVE